MPPSMHKKTKHSNKKDRTKINITLTSEDILFLNDIVKSGKKGAQSINRARILLLSHRKKTNREIVDALECSKTTISNIRKRYIARNKNVEATITDAFRSGQPKKILPDHEAFVIATACTDAPEGHAHWTAAALKERLLATYADLKTISDERIRRILLTNKLKPWREKNVVHSKAHASLS